MIDMRYVAALLIWAVVASASPSLQSDRATDDARITGRVLTESGDAVEGAQVYSSRRTRIGSRSAARVAGITAASAATTSTRPITLESVTGSKGETP
jgi:hypothetical protein